MPQALILIQKEDGQLYDVEGHRRNAQGQKLDNQGNVIVEQKIMPINYIEGEVILDQLEEIVRHVSSNEIEGTHESFLATIVKVSSDLDAIFSDRDLFTGLGISLLVDECYALISESEKLDTLRVEKLSKCHHNIDYLHALNVHELSLNEESSSLLENSYLGDTFNLDKILNEIDNPKVEKISRDEDIVLYVVDGDKVDYFFIDSFKHEVDFILPSTEFDPHVHLKIKEEFILYATLVVNVLDFRFSSLLWKNVSLFACFVPYVNRRRTKGRLAQPFDSHD